MVVDILFEEAEMKAGKGGCPKQTAMNSGTIAHEPTWLRLNLGHNEYIKALKAAGGRQTRGAIPQPATISGRFLPPLGPVPGKSS